MFLLSPSDSQKEKNTAHWIIIFLVKHVIDNKICHPRKNDFYMCAHAGMIVSLIHSFRCMTFVVYVSYCHTVVSKPYLIFFHSGTTRPTHYHVLWDEVGFSADDLQELVHSLFYV